MAYGVRPAACEGCPANSWGVGWVPPSGPANARVVFLGQGPGESEAEFSLPFHPTAPSGARLSKWMSYSGWQRSEVLLGNVVQCWLPESKPNGQPKGNREPTEAEVRACWHRHVGPWLASLPHVEHVIAVGASATKWLLGLDWGRGAERFAGTTQQVELPPLEATP